MQMQDLIPGTYDFLINGFLVSYTRNNSVVIQSLNIGQLLNG